jgi:hypothetical protein
MNTNDTTAVSKPQSLFITLLAWFSIAVSALMLTSSLMQIVMVSFVFPPDMLDQAVAQSGEMMPSFVALLFSHFKLFLLAYLLVSVLLLVASVGLLKRRNWARITFIVLLALSIAASIGSLFMQLSSVDAAMKQMDGFGGEEFKQYVVIVEGMMLGFAIVFSAIHAWLIYKLCTPQIRDEFA